MKLLSKWWKFHSAMLISLSLVLAGCGGAGGEGSDAGKGSGSNAGADNSIPDNSGTTGSNGSGSDSGSGTVVDNSNTDTLPTGNESGVEIFVDTNNAIDDLSLLNAGGVPTFGKKSKGSKSMRGKAIDLDNIWAIQYSSSGEIESIYPTTKSGSKYSFTADLSNTRDYKFVFLGYENERWTGDADELYQGPIEETTTIGAAGPVNELNGVTDATGASPFLRTASSSATKASLPLIGDPTGGITLTAKKAGDAGNSITVLTQETTRATYFVGVINGKPAVPIANNPFIRYQTVEGTKGNVNINFKLHAEFTPALLQPGDTTPLPAGARTITRAQGLIDVADEDFLMYEYSSYDPSSNTITIHYGPNTTMATVAFLLEVKNPSIIQRADVTNAAGVVDSQVNNQVVISQTESNLNSNNGNLAASGNINGVPTNFAYDAGTSTIFINMQKTNVPYSYNATSFYATKATSSTASRPTVTANAATGGNVSTVGGLMQAFADASSNVRDLVDITLVGTSTNVATSTHSTAVAIANRRLSGGANASGSTAIQNFDKATNPSFVWTDALNLFNPDSNFTAGPSTLGLRSGSSISPRNPVGFDNLYKNFTYFGILHLTAEDIGASKKSKLTSVEAKIVSAQSYRKEGNIGPAVTSISGDTFTLGAPTGEIILNIRNYFQSDVSLDDLRITVGIKDNNLDSDSGKVSVALPIPAVGYTIPIPVSTNAAPVAGATDDDANILVHPVSATDTLITFNAIALGATVGNVVKEIFPSISSINTTALFAHGDVAKQNFTITKKSRTPLVKLFQWEDETTVALGFVPKQQADTDTIVYDQDQDFTTASGGRDLRSSFFSRGGTGAGNEGTYVANTGGEFLDIEYHLYYRPRSAVGTDTITVFIEDGTKDPTGNLAGPRDPSIASTTVAGKIAESQSPTVGLDGTIIPYNGSDKNLIYNTLSLEVPVDTVFESEESFLEEPDALVSFSIVFDAVANSGSTAGQSESDPSTMTVNADLINERAGETYTYRWNWSRYFELAGDNAFIGMPAGVTLHGADNHQVTFSDATGLHPQFTTVKVTIRASEGLDPEGTLRPFDPSTFDPTLTYVENVDRDYVFLDNYDSGIDALNLSAGGFKAAVKMDLTTDPTEAHVIVTPKTNSSGQIIASASEIAEAIRFYLANANKITSLLTADSSFKLMDVYAKGSTTDPTPYWTATEAADINGQVLGNARTADDNAGSSLELNFANSDDYLNVRDAGSPVLSVTILDTVETHNGSTFIVNLSNAFPPVLEDPGVTLSDVLYSFVSLASDGVTASSKKSKTNTEQFLSVADDTDADGAVTFNMRVKRVNAGVNDTELMQAKTVTVDGSLLGGKSTRENQFVAYWDIKRVSDQTTQRLLAAGNSNVNDWVVHTAVDFVGSGADGNANSITYAAMYKAVYNANIAVAGATTAEADAQAKAAATNTINGITGANLTLALAVGEFPGTGNAAGSAAATAALTVTRTAVINRVSNAIQAAHALEVPAPTTTLAASIVPVTAAGQYAAGSAVVGLKANIFNSVYTAVDVADTPVVSYRLALAGANAVDNGITDVTADAEMLATYNAVYTPTYVAALAVPATVPQATSIATIAATAAAAGCNNANLVLIVNSLPGSAAAVGTAASTALATRLLAVRGLVNAAITASVNTAKPALGGGQPAAAIAAVLAAWPAGAAATGMRSIVYNATYTSIDVANTPTQSTRVANASPSPFGNIAEDSKNLIPSEAQKFNLGSKGNAGEHSATLATDPDDPTNVDLQHMLFSCRLILPTAASARDSYMVNFRFRPGVADTISAPPIMTNSFIITVTE